MSKPIKKRRFADPCNCRECRRERMLLRFGELNPDNIRLTEHEQEARDSASKRLGQALNMLGHHVREIFQTGLADTRMMQGLTGKLIALAREAASAAESLRR
jgi:hypothetical protein